VDRTHGLFEEEEEEEEEVLIVKNVHF